MKSMKEGENPPMGYKNTTVHWVLILRHIQPKRNIFFWWEPGRITTGSNLFKYSIMGYSTNHSEYFNNK